MRLLPKLQALQRRSEVSQRRCESLLAQLAREDDDIRRDEDALMAQAEGLRQLLESIRLTGSVLDRDQLFAQLRKQAVLQHQLQNLGLQSAQLEAQRKTLAQRRLAQQDERRVWLRKDDKYQRWTSRVRYQKRLLRLRQDEVEQEERTLWNP
ncbi:hypothetical protein [Pluralibacter sp.]|uniref:hypothetical protein n=1 Tax=Pluralibacter sp. TaxID=1920032 RepID=UPI0025D7EF00|nr:hypothetical protein [Pluralibacter sp.]MBV8045304.1 hypothetical protein [Pluralibacter sp.]